MCGIAGIVRLTRAADLDPAEAAARVSMRLGHRGPDGAGAFVSDDRRAALVHRRLAIIDLTPGAAQPMASPDGRYRLVFNGEVYNYRELKSDLEAHGETFRTRSDTEVLLRILIREGGAGLARVRGMFALGLWDSARGELLLARDRFGIKPLYVAGDATRVAFASELGALWRSGVIAAEVAPEGVLAYLRWGSIAAPLTWIRGVVHLEPGTWRRWDADGRVTGGTFADVRTAYLDRSPCSRDELRGRVRAGVEDSVRAHLVADVPVGVFLSGGVDSSSIVAAARALSASDLHTFTVSVDDRTSEDAYARLVATHFGTIHHVLNVDAASVVRELPSILTRLDQPTLDGVNTYFVSKAVASTGIKAVLSGTGGDELFGGYPSFTRLPRALRAKRVAGPLVPVLAPAIRAMLPPRLHARWTHFAAGACDVREAYRAQRGFLMPAELAEVEGPALRDAHRSAEDAVAAMESRVLDAAGPERVRASIARLETRHYLGAQLLRDIDVMSMAHGLEVRVPLVDHELVAAVWPDVAHYPDLLAHKALLHTTLARRLPPAIAARRKQGFTLPFDAWIRGDLADFVRSGLDDLVASGWVTRDGVDRTWTAWTRGHAHWSQPWTLGVLGRFLHDASVPDAVEAAPVA